MSRSPEQHWMEPFYPRTSHFCSSAYRSTLLLLKQTWKNVPRYSMVKTNDHPITQYSHGRMDRKLFNRPPSVSRNKELCSCLLYFTQAHQNILQTFHQLTSNKEKVVLTWAFTVWRMESFRPSERAGNSKEDNTSPKQITIKHINQII